MTLVAADIRDATAADAEFLAWVMLTASRSHLPRGIYEYAFDANEGQALELLRRITLTDDVHICHHSLFRIAEVDGRPAAAMCGFDSQTHEWPAVFFAAARFIADVGLAFDDGFMQRAEVLKSAFPGNEPGGAWVVENVATWPEFRRRGLVARLIQDVIGQGREKGFKTAQIGVLIGNEPARKAYLRAGFKFREEKRTTEFEAALGSPGGERLAMSL